MSDAILSVIAVAGALVLALTGMRWRKVSGRPLALMIGAWVLIFGAIAAIFAWAT